MIKKRYNTIAIVSLLIFLVLVVMLFFIDALGIKNNNIITVRKIIKSDANVLPIVYLETGIGSDSYQTKSYLINKEEIKQMENYQRSFSRTFPTKALENKAFVGNDNVPESLGQLMVYYNTINGPVYLFEYIGSQLTNQDSTYTLFFNNNLANLKYTGDSSLFDINRFNDYFYIFCYNNIDKFSGYFNEIVIYKYSLELKYMQKFKIDMQKMNLSHINLVNDSLVIKNDTVYFSIQKKHRFYTVSYNLINGSFHIRPISYEPICHIIKDRKIYSIGTKGSKFVIEETQNNNQISYLEINYPNGTVPTFGVRKQYIYGIDNFLLGSALDQKGRTILFTFDIDNNTWSNWWIVSNKTNYVLADYKYVITKDEKEFDLLPYNFVQ